MVRAAHLASLALLAAMLATVPAARAQTQAQADRIDDLTRYAMYAGACDAFGIPARDGQAEQIGALALAEAESSGLDKSKAAEFVQAAVDRHGRSLEIDFQALVEGARTGGRKLSEIAPAFRKIGENCVEAAADPAAGKYLVLPAGFDLDKAVTAAVDKLLVSGGLASWQTPAIQARGDLLMAAAGRRSAARAQTRSTSSIPARTISGNGRTMRRPFSMALKIQISLNSTSLSAHRPSPVSWPGLPRSRRKESRPWRKPCSTLAENVEPSSRLSCQIKVSDELDGLIVRMPESQH